MPLDHTGRRAGWAPTERDGAGRPAVAPLLALALVLLTLLGCNTGAMTEARRSQTFDEQETPQLTAQQATRTARTFFAPTGTPAPTRIPSPSVETLVVTLGVNPDGSPAGAYLSLPQDAGTVYAAAEIGNVVPGQRVDVIFTDANGNRYAESTTEMTVTAETQWLDVPLNVGVLAGPGEYAVYVYSSGHQIGSLAFTVAGAGAGAQLLPDLPANPQARTNSAPQSNQNNQQGGDNGNAGNDGNDQEQQSGVDQPGQDQWQDGGEQPAEGQWQEEEAQSQ